MAYNMASTGAVRIGNWQEELVLKETTGIRFAPNPKDRSLSLMTKSRCIDHTERLETKDYQSVMRSTMIDPRSNLDANYVKSLTYKPRQLLMEKKFREQVDEGVKKELRDADDEKFKPNYATISSSSFVPLKPGFSETLLFNDPNIRIQGKNQARNYAVETARTYYLHAVERGKGSLNFPVTFINSTNNPFRKTTSFSADIRVPMLRRAESNEAPFPSPKVKDFRLFRSIREKVLRNKKGITLHNIIVNLWANELQLPESDQGTGLISLNILDRLLSSPEFLEISLANEEIESLRNSIALNELGTRNSLRLEYISIHEFVSIVRGGVFTPHQQSIVEAVFDRIDAEGKGYLTRADITAVFNENAVGKTFEIAGDGFSKKFTYSLDDISKMLYELQLSESVDGPDVKSAVEFFDFLEYYTNLSAVINGNAELFEDIIRAQWCINI